MGSFESRRGTQKQAVGYAMKKDHTCIFGPVFFGELRTQGVDSQTLECMEYIRNKKPIEKDIAEEFPLVYCRYYKALLRYKLLCEDPRPNDQKTDLIVIYGPAGTGKSTFCRKLCEDMGIKFYKKNSTKWWCGYQQEPAVIWDEMDLSDIKCVEYLQLFDKGNF
jgi:Cdc6-like AAA superfamily ATPase